MEIHREDFEDYEIIRESGRTNMMDVTTVVALSNNLDRQKCFDIMKNYSKYKDKYSKG